MSSYVCNRCQLIVVDASAGRIIVFESSPGRVQLFVTWLNFKQKMLLWGAECKDDQVNATQQCAFLAKIQMAKPNSAILFLIFVKKGTFPSIFYTLNSFQSRPLPQFKLFQAYFGLNLPAIALKSGSFWHILSILIRFCV